MLLHLVFVGKTNFPEIGEGIQRYLERIRHYLPVRVHTVKAERILKKSVERSIREVEGRRILDLVGKAGYLIVWDQEGQQMDSVAFAQFLRRLENESISNVWMVIGGPLGVSSEVRAKAGSVLSLSKMTFPHDLARLLVVEQVYRAYTILRGEPYHK